MFSKKPKIKSTYNIVFDIRNSSVAVAVLENYKVASQIIYTDRKYLSSAENNEAKSFMKNAFKSIDELIDKIHKNKINKQIVKKIDKVVCVFASPWYENKIESFTSKSEKPIVFTKDFLNKNLSIDKFKDSNKVAIENELISINLNGYEVDDPFKKTFTSVEASFYRGIIDKKVENYLKNKIKDNFKTKKVIFHTHPFVILHVLKSNFHSIDNFCLFDIGMNTTEISIYREGIFKKIISIPKGFKYLISELSKKDGSTDQTTLSKTKLVAENELTDESHQSNVISHAKEMFKDLKQEGGDDSISHTIFITTDKDYKEISKNIFTNKEFYSKVLGLSLEPIVRVIDSNTTKDIILYKEGVEVDPILSIISNFSTIDF
jgi:hypothetical protein